MEHFGEKLKHLHVILVLYLTLESVYLVHIQTFVVAAGEVQMLWIHHLEGEEQQHDLKRERTAIDEIAVEKIRVVLGRISKLVKYMEQIVVLAVCVAANVDVRALRYRNIDERRQRVKLLLEVDEYPKHELLVQLLLSLQMLSNLERVVMCKRPRRSRPIVALLYHDIVYMQLVGYWLLGGLVAVDRLFESFSLYLLVSGLEFLERVTITWLELPY
mmetsp:Transcript_9532/g.21534  ORF Transcript_9532/g.21534 Transcript_9532/m.21534 type:complete len:216 (+) Transcript_9532:1307-1954(+)